MNEPVDFGFREVPREEKARRVDEVFSSVASRYDLMNDLMSFGIHRYWKRLCVHLARLRPGSRVLDVASGTGDLAALLNRSGCDVVSCDINEAMLRSGRDKLADRGTGQATYITCGQTRNGCRLPTTASIAPLSLSACAI